jgi:hypothetical protein
MASSEAGAMKIVTIPRLPIGRLSELRRFLDQTVFGLPSEGHIPEGEHKHGEVQSSPGEPVRESAAGGRTSRIPTTEGIAVTRIAVDRGSRDDRRKRGSGKVTGGRL